MNGRADFDAGKVLAPTGRLRVGACRQSAVHGENQSTGEIHGLSIDLGKAFAKRLGVPFERLDYQRIAQVLAAMKAGASISRSATRRRRARSTSTSARR